jgi:hypothetical protein
MDAATGPSLPPGLHHDVMAARFRRWPCPSCGYESRRFLVTCPECGALPWPVGTEDEARPTGPLARAGTDIEVRSRGVLRNEFRFSTPTGFLGILSRRFTGRGEWLGADGSEWVLERFGLLGNAYLLHDNTQAIAAAESPSLLREFFRGNFRVLFADSTLRFFRTGLYRHSFLLAVEDGIEVLRIHGSWIDPLRRVEVLSEAPMALVVLAAYLACGLRQGEGEL